HVQHRGAGVVAIDRPLDLLVPADRNVRIARQPLRTERRRRDDQRLHVLGKQRIVSEVHAPSPLVVYFCPLRVPFASITSAVTESRDPVCMTISPIVPLASAGLVVAHEPTHLLVVSLVGATVSGPTPPTHPPTPSITTLIVITENLFMPTSLCCSHVGRKWRM